MKLQVPLDSNIVRKLLKWADSKFDYVAYFTDNNITYPHGGFRNQLFAGDNLIDFNNITEEAVGIISYDYKNQLENLYSENKAVIEHPDTLFFIPDLKILFNKDSFTIEHTLAESYLEEIINTDYPLPIQTIGEIIHLTTKKEYLHNVNEIKNHIIEGDVYEMNYCMAFQSDLEKIDPTALFLKLIKASPMPFSVYFKAQEKILICASPERFIRNSRGNITAQPIKGTIRRGSTSLEDEKLKSQLLNSEKERSENLMIVDLMRNDLSKISITGSVQVEELFGIYSFQQVHQMISTVNSTLKNDYHFEKIIQNTFPMGSMTGAPKIKCMDLIDRYENFKRGWFSGTVGYVDEEGNFDFNVIIRSIFLDLNNHKLMFAVGSAITYDADPEQEYAECLLKARSIFEILSSSK